MSSPTTRVEDVAKALASETGISEQQASELVRLLGFNYSSLVFNARALKRKDGIT